MTVLQSPWLIHEAEVALWPAWKDGMPFRGPGLGRGRPGPLVQCKASLAWEETHAPGAPTGHGWTGEEAAVGKSYGITLTFPDGAHGDALGRLPTWLAEGGFHILTVRFADLQGRWTCLRFFYVRPEVESVADGDQRMQRTLRLRAGWKQETTGTGALPSMEPVLLGEVEWVCGPRTVRALTYDPDSETWDSTSENETGDGSRHVTLTPVTADAGADVALAVYLPRAVPAAVTAPDLPRMAVAWQNTLALRVGNHASAAHHGLSLLAGHLLQAVGIPEPLLALPQSRMLDEPVVVFRYGRRVYATLGHGVLAVPALRENEAPPVTHDPAFRLAVPGPANPATGQCGLTLLPNGAWLDGTVRLA